MDIINNRRSVRVFNENKVISQVDLIKILAAGMMAPSARNQQPWEFIVVRDQAVISNLKKISKGSLAIENSKLVVALIIKSDNDIVSPDFVSQDMAACMQNMLLEATSLKIGSCWIGIYPVKERVESAKKVLKTDKKVFALLSLGYPKNDEVFKEIDRFDANRISYLD